MGSEIGEGKNVLRYSVGKNPERVVKAEHKDDGNPVEHTDEDLSNFTVSFSRTIALKNYEFARVGMGIKVGIPFDADKSHRNQTYNRMRDAITEMLDREESVIRAQDRDVQPIDLSDVGENVVVWIDYGMTFKTGKSMDSQKIDITQSRRLENGSDFEAAVEALGEEVGRRIGEQRDAVTSGEGKVGF